MTKWRIIADVSEDWLGDKDNISVIGLTAHGALEKENFKVLNIKVKKLVGN